MQLSKFKYVFVAFSGGKDSVASYLKVREKLPNTQTYLIFTDTGHEMPETYEYLRYFHNNVHPVIRLAQREDKSYNGKYRKLELLNLSWDEEVDFITIFDELENRHKKRPDSPFWPRRGIRYCTKTLKILPFFKYLRRQIPKGEREKVLIVKGLRQEESTKREDTPEFDMQSQSRDIYWVWHPVYNLTREEVFQLHVDNDIKINKVYSIRSRSNCVGCPFASISDIKNTAEKYPSILDRYKKLEEETGYSWDKDYTLDEIINRDFTERDLEILNDGCYSGFCDI